MLEELRIQNFAIIDSITLDLAAGFNVITGETGAGKSIIIDAVELLLGGKADPGMVGTAGDKAQLEGVFFLSDVIKIKVLPLLEQLDLLDEDNPDYVTLSREIRANGRSSARLNGVTINTDQLREIGECLIDIHGQSAHLSLLKASTHIELLDHYADLTEVRDAFAKLMLKLTEIRREIKNLQADKEALIKRAERLRFEIEEIEAAALKPDEWESLETERNRLANSEQLAKLAGEAHALLYGDDSDEALPLIDMAQQVAAILDKLARIDKSFAKQHEEAETLSDLATELGLNVVRYVDDIEFDSDSLNDIEERIELIKQLKRRYKVEDIAGILAYAEKAVKDLHDIDNSEERLNQLAKEEDLLLRHMGELASRISKARIKAGLQLSKRVVTELNDLRMQHTRFEVQIQQKESAEGCYVGDKRYAFNANGIDQVEFMMSANPGQPLQALAKVASGGEAARIMLALKRVLSLSDQTPTLIFDEIDQGIGGRIGSVVGEKLWSLSHDHQVLVVTHLPQLASFGDKHYQVKKSQNRASTRIQVISLNGLERVQELADMLGTSGDVGLESARNILKEAESVKQQG
ncbi:DNA repair protein RecN [Anaerolineales bacterium]